MADKDVSETNERWVSTGMKIFWSLAATAMTILLFLLMAFLITPRADVPADEVVDVAIDITRHKREEASEEKNRVERKKPVQEELPPPPAIPRTRPQAVTNDDALLVDIRDFENGQNLFGANADRRATPIIRVPPQYPQSALIRGIEGWVMVEFTITAGGAVTDARVIESEPQGTFDRETLRAIKRWKYQPKIVDGQPVPQYNMRELVQFVLEEPQ
jgi:protein TonB